MWKRNLSIQSLFPERNSAPSSATSSRSCGTSEPGSSGKTLSLSSQQEQPKMNCNAVSFCFRAQVDHDQELQPKYESPPARDLIIDIPPKNLETSVGQYQDDSLRPSPAFFPTTTRFSTARNKRGSLSLKMYVPLYQAALKGDWNMAKDFIELHPSALCVGITKGRETVLHIAAGAKQTKFVEELVKLMNVKDLEQKNKYDNTALCFAAASGIKRIAEVMVEKNKNLPSVRGSKGVTPLHMAAMLGHRDMVWFLYKATKDEQLTKQDFIGLLIATITSDLYDVSLYILDQEPELAIERDLDEESALHVLARKPSASSSVSGLGAWQRFIYPWICMGLQQELDNFSNMSENQNEKVIQTFPLFNRLIQKVEQALGVKEVRHKKQRGIQSLKLVKRVWQQILSLDDRQIRDLLNSPSRPLFVATEFGNFDFVFELLHSYPDLIWKVDEQSRSIFHIAVMYRQEKIFKLIYEIGAHKDLITSYKDTNNTTILHLAAKLAPSNRLNIVSGAALQMQRELLWFKEVEKNVQPLYKEMKDMGGFTPRVLFTEEHKGLVKAGERWMKGTASSCMLVATLITTVMFAAIFTVPGGNNSRGNPIFLQTSSFMLFAVSDAFALFSSVTGILIFLSILTSRYAEEDFLESLPKRLIVGLITLFFSIASMLVAFSASFFIVLGHQIAWVVIPLALTACIPVMLFAFLQFPLLTDMINSTYGSGIFHRCNRDRPLY